MRNCPQLPSIAPSLPIFVICLYVAFCTHYVRRVYACVKKCRVPELSNCPLLTSQSDLPPHTQVKKSKGYPDSKYHTSTTTKSVIPQQTRVKNPIFDIMSDNKVNSQTHPETQGTSFIDRLHVPANSVKSAVSSDIYYVQLPDNTQYISYPSIQQENMAFHTDQQDNMAFHMDQGTYYDWDASQTQIQ